MGKIKGLRGVRNARDFNEIPVSNGCIKPLSFIRSSRLDRLSSKKLNRFLNKYNVKHIIDLRTDVEVSEGKSLVLPIDVNYYHIPILDHAFWGITHEKKMSKVMKKESKNLNKDFDTTKYMISMYENILYNDYSISKLKEIFDIFINNTDGAILFHCSAGKDRTGILSLLLLSIFGANENDILSDYIVSNKFNRSHNLKRKIALQIFFMGPNRFKSLLFAMMNAKIEYMKGLIDSVKAKYGTVMSYIENVLKLTKDQIKLLQDRYLVYNCEV